MKLKSYYSDTVEAAVRLASVELGPDAVFLGSKKSEAQTGGHYEVTFAVLDRKEDARGGRAAAPPKVEARRAAAARPAQEIWPGTPAGQNETLLHPQDDSPLRGQSAGDNMPHWREFVERASLEAEETVAPDLTATPPRDRAEERSKIPREPAAAARSVARSTEHLKATVAVSDRGTSDWRAGFRRLDRTGSELSLGAGVLAAETVPVPTPSRVLIATAPARVPLFGSSAASLPNEENISSSVRTQTSGEAGLWAVPGSGASSDLRDSVARLSRDVEQLRSWLQHQFRAEQAVLLPSGELLTHPILAEVYFHLLGNDVDAALAAQLASALRSAVEEGAGRERVRELLALRLQALFRTANGVGETGLEPRVAAVVGPTGAGKTTALAKLAIRFGLGERRRVHLLTIDPLRVGAVEQLQAYAGLLEMPLTPVSDLALLPRLLSQLSQSAERPDLILIDTPGYGPAEMDQADRLAECLLKVRSLDVHLVLGLTAKPKDLRRGLEQYRVFQPAKLLFTRLDETDSYGPILNESVRTRLPMSFFSTGQRVPDDLTPATGARLIDLILNRSMAG